ncbi:MAG: sugar ABC transporter substrate-binding protein [Phycisphaerae bacterium]|nr:sugar ABC transporter substrate-binding protein [Phycisphaerae bacterium]
MDGAFVLSSAIQERVDAGEELSFAYVSNDTSIAYIEPQKAGVAKAAEELGVKAETLGSATGSAEEQISIIQTLITQGKIDGIAVAAVNVDSLKPVIEQAFEAGIPLISVFTDQPDSKQLAYVGTDLEAAGKLEGDELVKALDGQAGTVVVVSIDAAAGWSSGRFTGFSGALAANPELKVVGPITTGAEPGQMFNTISNAMTANPDAVAIASMDCCSLTSAAKWVVDAGQEGAIKVVGHDALQSTINSIEDGVIQFGISQDPVNLTYTAIKELNDFVRGGPLPETKPMEFLLVTKDNASDITPEG